MQLPEWRRPSKVKGQSLKGFFIKITPGFYAALTEFSKRESERVGFPVSRSNILETTVTRAYPDLRQSTNRINREIKKNETSQPHITKQEQPPD